MSITEISPWSGLPNGLPKWVAYSGTTDGEGDSFLLFGPNVFQRGWKLYAVDGDLWVNDQGGTAFVDTAGSFKIPMGCMYESPFGGATPFGVSICDTGVATQYTGSSF